MMPHRSPSATVKVLFLKSSVALLLVLADPSEWARELRHVSPFGGVLSARERLAVYRAFAREEGTR